MSDVTDILAKISGVRLLAKLLQKKLMRSYQMLMSLADRNERLLMSRFDAIDTRLARITSRLEALEAERLRSDAPAPIRRRRASSKT